LHFHSCSGLTMHDTSVWWNLQDIEQLHAYIHTHTYIHIHTHTDVLTSLLAALVHLRLQVVDLTMAV